MNRRIFGIAGAAVLAVVGTFVLVGYVQSAREEAVAAEALVDVWVVDDDVPAGTPGEKLAGSLRRDRIPARTRAAGSVSDLDDLDGLVSTVDLVPGEQLVRARFTSPAEARRGPVPDDLLQVTVELTPDRALGGRLRPGDRVGVLISFEPFDLEGTIVDGGAPEPLKGKTANTTHLALHQVLVSGVQIKPTGAGVPAVAGEDAADEKAQGVAPAPSESLFVTLALDAPSVEDVVFAAEYGSIWLAAEPPGASSDGSRIADRGNIYGRATAAAGAVAS
jgi:pilus assembly protein CpaB